MITNIFHIYHINRRLEQIFDCTRPVSGYMLPEHMDGRGFHGLPYKTIEIFLLCTCIIPAGFTDMVKSTPPLAEFAVAKISGAEAEDFGGNIDMSLDKGFILNAWLQMVDY